MTLINAYVTHREPPQPAFPHELVGWRDRSDPELAEHLDGFMGFVMGGGSRPMTAMRYGLMRHLERVQHQVALEVEDAHMEALAGWAAEANAVLFLPDGTVRAPDGAVLVAPDSGDPEPGAAIPYAPDARARKAATDAALDERGIRVPPSLPPVVAEVEVELREASEVARRCLALLVCAVRGESLASGDPLTAAQLEKRLPLGVASLSPAERAFFDDEAPSRQDVLNHTWRYEALAVLAWAVQWLDELPFPAVICDVPSLARRVADRNGGMDIEQAALRAPAEILDALDLTFRLHWAVTDARVNDRPPVAGVEAGVVAERHHALNWLVGFEGADWDDVTTPT